MALTDSESHSNLQRPVPVPLAGGVVPKIPAAIPHAFIARLPVLHAEAVNTLRLGRFVANSVPLAGLLMLAGGLALLAGGGGLQEDFAWSVLTLIGIAAIAANYIRGPARSLETTPVETSAANLRAILLYTGFAWGAGAFLALPPDPALGVVLGFALVPMLLAVLLLPDEGGVAAFVAPVACLTAAAGLSQDWTAGRVASLVILAAGIAVITLSYVHRTRARLNPGHPA